jgi:hypothetical protein
MERLPYIDEHSTTVGATPERVWAALIATWRAHARSFPGALAAPWGLTPARVEGDWEATPRPGDCVPGFSVVRSQAPCVLELRGRHRFSRYALVFELAAHGESGCTLSARSWAEFPGLAGRAYRALVIGSGGHRLMVRRLLRGIAGRA